jgi:ectoine hydroxylase-related dioxygenase (phytanoyl-CoA dioxygenase family)
LDLETAGYAVVDPALKSEAVDQLVNELARLDPVLRTSGRGGLRNVLRLAPSVLRVMQHPAISEIVHSTLGAGAFLVKGILFDKHPGSNWNVPWHQDLTVAVRAQTPAAGFGPWSVKAGVIHVQPPVPILERMLAVRLHLDDCGDDDGPLRVLPGSHRHGEIAGHSLRAARERYPEVTCTVSRGGILAMRPLLMHASSRAATATRRRVLHLEFAASELAERVTWFDRWQYAC